MDNNQDDREEIDSDEDVCSWCGEPAGATIDIFEGTEHAGGVGVKVLGLLVPCGDHLAHEGDCQYECKGEHEDA